MPYASSRDRLQRLAEWFEAEYDALLRFGCVLTGDWYSAEDLLHDAFVRLYRMGSRIEPEGTPAYARRTMVHLSRSKFRRRIRERSLLETANSEPARDPADRFLRDDIWRAILGLSPQQRACVALRYYEDLADGDIARTLGIGVGSVKKHLARAMKKLRAALAREES